MDIEEMKFKLEQYVFPKRFIHSLNVMNTAIDLAKKYKEDIKKVAVAALLHDCARDIDKNEFINLCNKFDIPVDDVSKQQVELLHGPIGASVAKYDYGVDDESILRAIYYHTTACENMTMIDKIVFVADYIEPDRNFPGVNKARELAYVSLDKTILFSLDKTVNHIINKGGLIHLCTINARNDLVLKLRS